MSNGVALESVPPTWLRLIVGRNPRRTAVRAVVLAIVLIFTFKFVIPPIRVEGISMAPNFREGRIHLINKFSYRWKEPQRGDVVAIRLAGESVMFLKRILALPGETIAIRNGIIYIDGQPLDEPYVRVPREPWNLEERTLLHDEYYVAGDNRATADMWHAKGVIRKSRIAGKVLI